MAHNQGQKKNVNIFIDINYSCMKTKPVDSTEVKKLINEKIHI